jgi:protein transport protein SEC61 subunit alpha
MMNFLTQIFCVVVYFQGFRVEMAVKSIRVRGQQGNYPIRLFYTSNMPIILFSALISNVYFFSQLLYRRFKNNFFVNMIGQWQEVEYTGTANQHH